MVRVWMLGGLRVSVGTRTIEEDAWRLRKAASLIKLLALAPGHRLHREQLMDLLWPELAPGAASSNLRRALHVARHTLDPTLAGTSRRLQRRGELVALCPEGQLWVDVEAFEEAALSARRSQEPAAYEAAIDLYAGELLPEDRYEEWAEERRQELRETYLSLLMGLASAHAERKDYGSAIEALRRVVSEEAIREEAHAELMRLCALSGRKSEALRQYETLRETFSRDLGVEPSSSSRALREEIASGRFPPPDRRVGSVEEVTPAPPRHNLPVPGTSFVGRERELVDIRRELTMARLLTLTGTGGTGKTRLALETARNLAGAYPGI